MNTPAEVKHEDWMTDDDIAIYDQMISMGRLQVGREIGKNEEYLLHIASMITLKQMKGMMVDVDDPTIVELKRIHKEHKEAGLIFETPPDAWYMSAKVLRDPYLPEEVQKEIDEANEEIRKKNAEVEAAAKTSNIADEEPDADITAGYVKIVPRPEPEVVPEP